MMLHALFFPSPCTQGEGQGGGLVANRRSTAKGKPSTPTPSLPRQFKGRAKFFAARHQAGALTVG
jgi:hypothetical protein